LLWKCKNTIHNHKSWSVALRASITVPSGVSGLYAYSTLIKAAPGIDIWPVHVVDVLEQGATISGAATRGLLSCRAQAMLSFSPKSLLRLSTLLFSFMNNAKREKRITLTLKAFSI